MDKLEKGKRATEKTLEKIGDVPISEIPAEMIERGRAATESLIAKYGHLTVRAINAVTFKDELRDAFPVFNDELDTDFLLELLYFVPIDKTYISTGSYDQYLYDLEKTVIDNYDSGNYQVSFFYAHLIYFFCQPFPGFCVGGNLSPGSMWAILGSSTFPPRGPTST